MNKEEGEAIQNVVKNIIERTISSLQSIGMSHEDALRLLVIQATIRMDDDTSDVKRRLSAIMGLDDPRGR